MKTRRKTNYDIYSGFSFYTPSVKGCVALLGVFLLGVVFASVVSAAISIAFNGAIGMEYLQLILYPLMFIPAMVFASFQSKKNSFFDEGYSIDNNNFGKLGGWKATGIAVLVAVCALILMDILESILPEMSEALQKAMESLLTGNFLVNFISVSIFAPIFEEWLCRGMILRGLLNYKRKNGNGLKPVWAIIISAAIFALIHGNIQQGAVAFIIGCLMGFIYYKTGSLKLTMLIHFVNNTISLVLSQIGVFEEYDHLIDVMGAKWYWLAFAAAAILMFLSIRSISKIKCQRPQGNCDVVNPADITSE